MESSYVPPEVAAQYANQTDQQGDDEQDSQSSSSQNQAADDSNPFGSADPSQAQGQQGVPGLSGSDPVGQQSGDAAAPSGPQETLTLKQQIQMLSPLGFLAALTGQVMGEKTQEQQHSEQQAQMRQQQLSQKEQQSWQMQQQRVQAEQAQITQQVETMKQQGRAMLGKDGKSSVLFSQTTQGDQSELALAERAAKDAQQQAAKRQQGGVSDPGSKAKQGPASMGDLAQQKSGMQKASEMSMGE